jgi:DNA polymerase III delta prime subunit
MQVNGSYLVLVDNQPDFIAKAEEICGIPNAATTVDALILEPLEGKRSIGIAQVKLGISFLHNQPYQLAHRFLFIPQANKLTEEAQNALLKTLEEPPSHAIIFLGSRIESDLLPTVVPRCKKIACRTPHTQTAAASTTSATSQNITYNQLVSQTAGERLASAESLAKLERNELSELVNDWIKQGREVMVKTSDIPTESQNTTKHAERIKNIIQIAKDLETTNVAMRLALEVLMLRL